MNGRHWILWMIVLAVLGGCGQAADSATGTSATGTSPAAGGLDRMRQHAQQALARYDQAVAAAGGRQEFMPVGGLTRQLGDWEAEHGDNNKRALGAGLVRATIALPAAPRPSGTVVWDTGPTYVLPLVSAGQAFDQLVAGGSGECAGCAPLRVTGVSLGTERFSTSRGWAVVPAWVYTLAGTRVRLAQVAVAVSAAVRVTPLSWDPYGTPGVAVELASTTVDSTQLTVGFVGAPGPGSEPCGADYSGETIESADAVVVIAIAHPYTAEHSGKVACTRIGKRRTAIVELARPLGERAVLDWRQGLPVPVTVKP